MDSINQFWNEVMQIKEARWIVAALGLITCVLVAYYFVKLFRDMAYGGGIDAASDLPDFERLRREGKLNDEEYNRLKKSIPKNVLPGTPIPGKSIDVKKDDTDLPDFRELKETD